MGNSFASLHFEYLLGETTVREIVKDCCSSIWNCLKETEMPEKTENHWVNKANDFYRRTQFPNCIAAVDGKHVRIKMPTGSGSLFYNYKHFFSILLLALVDANYFRLVRTWVSVQQRTYNYRLTRARRILANKWKIFCRPLDVTP